jgi:hypothetical protein
MIKKLRDDETICGRVAKVDRVVVAHARMTADQADPTSTGA